MTVKSQASNPNCRYHYSDVMFDCCLLFGWLVGWFLETGTHEEQADLKFPM